MNRTRVQTLVLLSLLVLPWTIFAYPSGTRYVFAWGLLSPDPVHVTTIYAYLFELTAGLPRSLLAWPLSVLLYAGALLSTIVGLLFGREDERVTIGLLIVAGASHASFALSASRQAVVALPIATVVLWALAGYASFTNSGSFGGVGFRER